MIWLPRTTDNSTYFAQSLEIRGIESRLYIQYISDVTLLCIGTFYSCNGMYVPNFSSYEILKWTAH